MRQTQTRQGLTVKAYAGTTGVLLAFNVTDALRRGLLGFAIARRDGRTGRYEWLDGMLTFPDSPQKPGQLIPTNQAPIQKFRWSDYRVYPDTTYEYTIQPVYGTPKKLKIESGITLKITTSGVHSALTQTVSHHTVLFNRAAAASQAFSRKFPQVEQQIDEARRAGKPLPELPPEALAWLSRGVLEQIQDFIQQAQDPTWALDIAIYEYELPAIAQAVEAAHARGVNVRVVYHAKSEDPQTEENEHHLAPLPDSVKRPRRTSKIFHHKFMVLSRMEGGVRQPKAVLCGSTNFTHNGVYRQANVVHIAADVEIAQSYLSLFDRLFEGASSLQTKRYIDQSNPIPKQWPTVYAGFSPRSRMLDLEAFQTLIRSAQQDVLFCTAFDLYDGLEAALLGQAHDPILRYGLQNSRSQITGFHADRSADFVSAAFLSEGLEGFLKESTRGQKGNILIHTKLVVVDFTSDSPIVLSGSHNLSKSASEGNDENFLVLWDPNVADCYGCELMRLYDHYRFRFRQKDTTPKHSLSLSPDDSWTNPYFEVNSLKWRDRYYFSGTHKTGE